SAQGREKRGRFDDDRRLARAGAHPGRSDRTGQDRGPRSRSSEGVNPVNFVRLTLDQVGKRLLLSPEAVLPLIAAANLRRINVSTGSKRPRWIVKLADLEAFEQRRVNIPSVTTTRRIRPPAIPNYFAGSNSGERKFALE